MKAYLDGVLVADATAEDLVRIEGNWYFRPSTIVDGVLTTSPTAYTCAWKGAAQYFDLFADGKALADGAWSYPRPEPSAIDRVGTDFSGYVAFDPRVTISE